MQRWARQLRYALPGRRRRRRRAGAIGQWMAQIQSWPRGMTAWAASRRVRRRPSCGVCVDGPSAGFCLHKPVPKGTITTHGRRNRSPSHSPRARLAPSPAQRPRHTALSYPGRTQYNLALRPTARSVIIFRSPDPSCRAPSPRPRRPCQISNGGVDSDVTATPTLQQNAAVDWCDSCYQLLSRPSLDLIDPSLARPLTGANATPSSSCRAHEWSKGFPSMPSVERRYTQWLLSVRAARLSVLDGIHQSPAIGTPPST